MLCVGYACYLCRVCVVCDCAASLGIWIHAGGGLTQRKKFLVSKQAKKREKLKEHTQKEEIVLILKKHQKQPHLCMNTARTAKLEELFGALSARPAHVALTELTFD